MHLAGERHGAHGTDADRAGIAGRALDEQVARAVHAAARGERELSPRRGRREIDTGADRAAALQEDVPRGLDRDVGADAAGGRGAEESPGLQTHRRSLDGERVPFTSGQDPARPDREGASAEVERRSRSDGEAPREDARDGRVRVVAGDVGGSRRPHPRRCEQGRRQENEGRAGSPHRAWSAPATAVP